MNEVERRALGALDVEGMLQFLRELIAIPSHGGEETAAQRRVASELGGLGFKVDEWEIDLKSLSGHPSFSMSIERERALGVVGVWEGDGGDRSLILNGHVDTVAPGDEENWLHPPLEGVISGGAIYGRGACDMKGGLSCAIYAARAIKDSGARLRGRLTLESVIGEEDGGAGTLAAVLRGYTADAAVVMEPSEAKIAPAHAGALSFSVNVPGRSAHACVREEGVSAIEKFMLLHEALRALEEKRNSGLGASLYSRYKIPYAINIGTVRGGTWPGSVAESLTFEGRIGVKVGERGEEARRSLEEAVLRACRSDHWLREHPATVEWSGYQFDPASIPLDEPVIGTVRGAFRDATGREAELEGMTYASDMRHLVNTGGTPTVIFGPGDVRDAHAPDEHVSVDELVAVARTLILTILRTCGHEED
jgi:acetylornithine deacetylase